MREIHTVRGTPRLRARALVLVTVSWLISYDKTAHESCCSIQALLPTRPGSHGRKRMER